MSKAPEACFWLRRDLRLEDNRGLSKALEEHSTVLVVFIFDRYILDQLKDKNDARVTFIHDQIQRLKGELQNKGSDLLVTYGQVEEEWEKILVQYRPRAIYVNKDFEPYARLRDPQVEALARTHDCEFKTYVDHIIFPPGAIVKDDGNPYSVYTPFSKKWLLAFKETTRKQYPVRESSFAKITDDLTLPSLTSMGFTRNTTIPIPQARYSPELLATYAQTRDLVSLPDGTSRLGIHLRFGTVSVREVVAQAALVQDTTFLKELVWREFFIHLLWFHPRTCRESFKPRYDQIPWRRGKEADRDFEAWSQGHTGYPLVDAGIRELNQTGYMHNRVRMITASFLCKHLLIDWRRGERYFAQKLLDYELASNVGNWQWASSGGADAAPYFRIFNPYTQQEKFDPDWTYISRWVPEYDTEAYPSEIVDYKEGRERALQVYKDAVG